MAGLFDKQAEMYLDARPNYPKEWFSMLADQTDHHSLAWDVGTGNGQAALGVSPLSHTHSHSVGLFCLEFYSLVRIFYFFFWWS